jgi:S-formylglutathione hydrolase FrmB
MLFVILVGCAIPAQGQLRDHANLDRLNRRLNGHVVDYTHNHGADRRIYSPILGQPRDLYVYLPPNYSPANAYPLVLYFHMAFVDEHTFSGSKRIVELDRMIAAGEFPPAIIACPDGVITGENRFREPHSMYINGENGRFQDHIMQEVVPFLTGNYSVRSEREAHGLIGVSAGGFGAMNLAIKYRSYFGAVAILAGPVNLRYSTEDGNYHENFDPATYRWKTQYNPDEVIGRFYLGLRRVKAKKYIKPVFGEGPNVASWISQENPADLIFSTDLQPNQLAIYLNYPGKDNWNFDAQAESFAWLAAQKGITVTMERAPHARHNLPYFRANHVRAFCWLGKHLLPPAAVAPVAQ